MPFDPGSRRVQPAPLHPAGYPAVDDGPVHLAPPVDLRVRDDDQQEAISVEVPMPAEERISSFDQLAGFDPPRNESDPKLPVAPPASPSSAPSSPRNRSRTQSQPRTQTRLPTTAPAASTAESSKPSTAPQGTMPPPAHDAQSREAHSREAHEVRVPRDAAPSFDLGPERTEVAIAPATLRSSADFRTTLKSDGKPASRALPTGVDSASFVRTGHTPVASVAFPQSRIPRLEIVPDSNDVRSPATLDFERPRAPKDVKSTWKMGVPDEEAEPPRSALEVLVDDWSDLPTGDRLSRRPSGEFAEDARATMIAELRALGPLDVGPDRETIRSVAARAALARARALRFRLALHDAGFVAHSNANESAVSVALPAGLEVALEASLLAFLADGAREYPSPSSFELDVPAARIIVEGLRAEYESVPATPLRERGASTIARLTILGWEGSLRKLRSSSESIAERDRKAALELATRVTLAPALNPFRFAALGDIEHALALPEGSAAAALERLRRRSIAPPAP